MRTSYSALETFKQCPKRYELQEMKKIRVPKGKEAIFGTLIHDALRFMFSRDPVFHTLDEVVLYFTTGMQNAQFPDSEKERYLHTGKILLQKFWNDNQPWNYTVIDMESRFEITIEDLKEKKTHILAGIIDRIDKLPDGSFEVIDYKTSRRLPAQKDVDKNLQLSVYHLGISDRWPHVEPEKIRLSLYFLKAGEKLSTTRNHAALGETKKTILDYIREIESRTSSGDFPPIPSELCNWCGYKPLCPAWKHLYRKDEKFAPEEIENIDELALEFIRLKRAQDENKKQLATLQKTINEYLDTKELTRLFMNDVIIARSEIERKKWDLPSAEQLLKSYGLWDVILSPDEKKFKERISTLSSEQQKELETLALSVAKTRVLKLQKNLGSS